MFNIENNNYMNERYHVYLLRQDEFSQLTQEKSRINGQIECLKEMISDAENKLKSYEERIQTFEQEKQERLEYIANIAEELAASLIGVINHDSNTIQTSFASTILLEKEKLREIDFTLGNLRNSQRFLKESLSQIKEQLQEQEFKFNSIEQKIMHELR